MPHFSRRSLERLATCDIRLQRIMHYVIQFYDCAILYGHRNEEEQEDAFERGATTKHWPDSKHNSKPSKAVDIAPYPVDWKNEKEFYFLAGLVTAAAEHMGIKIRWGGRWSKLHDTPHIELDE